MKYTYKTATGLGKKDRERLAEVLRGTKGTISVKDASTILKVSPTRAAQWLARWANKGWLCRIRRGFYVPVPLESRVADVALEDSWIIADRIYNPSYIGGWSAAGYWTFTEQIFRTVAVLTTQKPRDRNPVIRGTRFLLRTIPPRTMFGIKKVWRGSVRVSISDPSRTVLDMLNDPKLGGGLRPMVDIFTMYLKSDKKDMALLLDYAKRLDNGAVFKRMGFLLERLAPDENDAIKTCRSQLTTGNANLDPALDAARLITRWKLWIPPSWSEAKK